jgi:hypothetical protein
VAASDKTVLPHGEVMQKELKKTRLLLESNEHRKKP